MNRGPIPATRLSALAIGLLLILAPTSQSAAVSPEVHPAENTQTDPRTMRFEPVEFTPPEPERVVLENGMVVYLLEDHELPLVTITATIQTGAWLDPPEKIALAGLTGHVMRTGGTDRMAATAVDEELERLAALVTVGLGVESGFAMLDVLKKDLDRGLMIFSDILRTPAFDPARVELAKLQAIEGIRRRQDRPQSIARREFTKLLYGPTHPFARESSVKSVSRITREDLLGFHKRTFHPNGIILGVTGDFDSASMLDRLRKMFGGWAKGTVLAIEIPPVAASVSPDETGEKKIVRFIGKGTTQTYLRMGHLSLKEDDPDYPALSLLNDILGGSSFRSRLFQDLRTKHGLAYSVGSALVAGTRARGAWLVAASTDVNSTQEAISRMVEHVERLREQAVTDVELHEAKEAFVNSFVFSFTSPSRIVSRLIGLEYDGLPKDFLQQLRDKVVKLTKEDLLRAARKHLHPERLKILAVGPGQALVPILSAFGAVEEIELPPEG